MTLLCADVTCAWAESIALSSFSSVFFWFCFAVVMACWSARRVGVALVLALVSAFFSLVQLLLLGADVGVAVAVRPDIIELTVVDAAEFWQVRRFCCAVLTSAFCALVLASSLSCALLIAVSVDFWSRERCFFAVSSVLSRRRPTAAPG